MSGFLVFQKMEKSIPERVLTVFQMSEKGNWGKYEVKTGKFNLTKIQLDILPNFYIFNQINTKKCFYW